MHCYKNALDLAEQGSKLPTESNESLNAVIGFALIGWAYAALMSSNPAESYELCQIAIERLESVMKEDSSPDRDFLYKHRSVF